MEEPLISFIITYYEQPVSMVCECIESILALSLQPSDRQIILIDDGSAINPSNDLQRYENDIIYIRKANGGVSTARNMALQMATGIFVQFVDADDMLVKVPYEHCIEQARLSGTDMVMFDFCHSTDEKTAITDRGAMSGTELMRSQNIRGSVCCYLFRQSIRKDILFTPGITYGEDEEFTAQLLLRAESLHITSAKAYLYRNNATSITSRQDKRSIIRRLSDTRTVISRLHLLSDRISINDRLSLQRRIAQLTMDYIYNIIRLTGSRHYLERKIEGLRKEGLFPLPDKGYTVKYSIFRRLTNHSSGLKLLMRIIPLMNKER